MEVAVNPAYLTIYITEFEIEISYILGIFDRGLISPFVCEDILPHLGHRDIRGKDSRTVTALVDFPQGSATDKLAFAITARADVTGFFTTRMILEPYPLTIKVEATVSKLVLCHLHQIEITTSTPDQQPNMGRLKQEFRI